MKTEARAALLLLALGTVAALLVSGHGIVVGLGAGTAALLAWIVVAPVGLRRRVVAPATVLGLVALVAWLRL